MSATQNSFVRILDEKVEKYTATPCRTAQKYIAISEVAASEGFVAPRVLDTRDDCVVLERLHNIVSLRQAYMADDTTVLNDCIQRAGEVLAAIHAKLPTGPAVHWAASQYFIGKLDCYTSHSIDWRSLPQAALHGDYSFANVFLLPKDSNQIAIIDPCANFGSTFDDWTLGPIHLDIGKMLACLEGQIPVRQQLNRPSSARVTELQELFLRGYERIGTAVDRQTAHAFAFAVSAAQFRRRYGSLGNLHQTTLYNRLRKNFPAHRKIRQITRGNH